MPGDHRESQTSWYRARACSGRPSDYSVELPKPGWLADSDILIPLPRFGLIFSLVAPVLLLAFSDEPFETALVPL